MTRISTIDAEVAGEAVRLIVGGGPAVPGHSMAEKLTWLRRHGEKLRAHLMLEPRGHAGMHGALFCEPVSPNAHAGLLSMHAGGFPVVSGEGVIAAVTIAFEHKLIAFEGETLILDTPAGTVLARRQSPAGVAVTGVPSFVHTPGLPVRVGTRQVMVDVAFGGEFYAIADSEAVGIPIEMASAAQLVRMGHDVIQAVEAAISVVHPEHAAIKGIQGAIFTGASHTAVDLRSATVLDGAVLRRSPGVTGTAALLAVLEGMGLLVEDHAFTHEGILGTLLRGHVSERRHLGEMPAVIPVIEGVASITGFHEFTGYQFVSALAR